MRKISDIAKEAGFFVDNGEIYTSKLERLPITDSMTKFAELVINEYDKYLEHEERKYIKSKLGLSRRGLNNI